jgi:hypothetical protein
MRLPRQIKNSLLPLLLVFAAQKVCAQLAPADDFFNSGAQFYISNNIPAAKERVETGLKLYPDDVKLKKLEELLKQQQQSQSQSQQNQQQSQQDSAQNQNQQKPDHNQQQKDQQSQDQSGQQKDKQRVQQANSSGKQGDEKKDGQNGQVQASTAKEMSPQEARQLLDDQKGNEQLLQLKPEAKAQDGQKPVKDW